MCAAVATGVYPDFAGAAAAMAGPRETFVPDPANTAIYTRMVDEVYTRIRAATDPILERSFPIFR
jgi:ribulose kinase